MFHFRVKRIKSNDRNLKNKAKVLPIRGITQIPRKIVTWQPGVSVLGDRGGDSRANICKVFSTIDHLGPSKTPLGAQRVTERVKEGFELY